MKKTLVASSFKCLPKTSFSNGGTVVALILWCFWEVLILDSSHSTLPREGVVQCFLFLTLYPSSRRIVHKVYPMLKWEFINPLKSLFHPWSTIFPILLSAHQPSLVFQRLIFYIVSTISLYEQMHIYKPTLILHWSSILGFTLSHALMLILHNPTQPLYLSMLGYVQTILDIGS